VKDFPPSRAALGRSAASEAMPRKRAASPFTTHHFRFSIDAFMCEGFPALAHSARALGGARGDASFGCRLLMVYRFDIRPFDRF
jgi:hypothetical protein